MVLEQLKKKKLPETPGVYFFTQGRKILYIGKATSLKDRVRSYFSSDLGETRGPLIVKMLGLATGVKTISTDSVLEALILEVRLIRTHQPHYNSASKDDKSFNHIVITKEDFPQVLLVRHREVEQKGESFYKEVFGPFPHGFALKEAFKIIRKIFPFRDGKCTPLSGKPCFNRQIGLCPGVCMGEISKVDYARRIKSISLFLQGKKKTLISALRGQMKEHATRQEFEKAGEMKRQIFGLEHIQDVALIKADLSKVEGFRIEGYDVAHISGKFVVGVMTVVLGGVPEKSEYRKFRVKVEKGGDVGALKEILSRRFLHPEWPFPSLIVLDGGIAQLRAGQDMIHLLGLSTPIVSVVKDERHKPRGILGDQESIRLHNRQIIIANSEAHRFALSYHTHIRGKDYKKKFTF